MTAEAVELTGPKGWRHGWIFEGIPGQRLADMAPGARANLASRRAKTASQHATTAHLHRIAAQSATGVVQARHTRLANYHNTRASEIRHGHVGSEPSRRGLPAPAKSTFNRDKALRQIRSAQAKAPPGRVSQKTGPPRKGPPNTFNRKKALKTIRAAQARARGGRPAPSRPPATILATELARHVPIDPKIKLGSGGRFKKMKAKLAARGARNPGALAAFIGRRAYGPKKFAALGAHKHANTGPAVELAMRYPKYPVSSPYDVLVIRGDDGSAVIRHRRGGYEIARIRRTDTGSWVASRDGQDMAPHTRQRGALLEAIGAHNKSSGTPYHRAEAQGEPLQAPPAQTPLMAAYGIPAVRALATPTVGSSDGPRVTGAEVPGLGGKGKTIYKKLRQRGFPHERAHNFARRAQNRGRGK